MIEFEEKLLKGLTILNVCVDIIQVLFVQVLSLFEKLHSKFKVFFIEELKIL